jgi:PAS domain S-box-containing protein
MNKTHLKFLILEDNQNDLELIKAELQSSYIFEPEFLWVVQKNDFEQALVNYHPDIVLSDFGLPQFTGYQALEIAVKHDSMLPFMIVTGALSEEIAAESIKRGAWDYILKDKLNKLLKAVENALLLRNEKYRTYHAEQELRIIKKKLGIEIKLLYDAVERIPDSIVITETDGKISYVNSGFEKMTGYSAQEVIGKNLSILKSGQHGNDFYKNLWDTITSGKEWHGEIINKRKNGELYRETMSIAPILDEKGQIFYFVVVKHDTTEKMSYEQELIKAKEKAEESDRLKSSFLSNISHEIRTPMNSILGFSELLGNQILPNDKRIQYAEMINKAGKSLMSIISDIILISEIETGNVKVNQYPTEINRIVRNVYGDFVLDFSEKQIKFIRKKQFPDKQVSMVTDGFKLNQIISKLVDNALKYTENGSVEFGYRIISENEIEFFVEDTGSGISPDYLKNMFTAFRHSDPSKRFFEKGIGLGLAIVKSYVDLLGGKIEYTSEIGKGTRFTVNFPLKVTVTGDKEKMTEPNYSGIFAGKKILIAEDNEPNYLFLAELLEETQAELIWVKNGQDAVETVRNDKNISLLLLDIKIPKKDGLEVAKEIRTFNIELPIIAQTAFAYIYESEIVLKSGCNEHLTKPLSKDILLKTVKKYLIL